MARWEHDGSGPDGQRGRHSGRAGAGPGGDRAAAGARHGLTRHRRDGVNGPAAALVPRDVRGEPVLDLVAQAGIAAFVDWVKRPPRGRPSVAVEVFGTAPRELARAVTLQQAVEMVRVIIDVVEARVDELAAPGGEAELREEVLRYTREIAFGAAKV